MALSSKKSIENQEDSESSYYVEEEEIDEAKVNNMVRIFVNTFKRNPDLWQISRMLLKSHYLKFRLLQFHQQILLAKEAKLDN